MDTRTLLIVVDYQFDFAHPSGALYVSGGEKIRTKIEELLSSSRFTFRIATRDWHPPNHISFAASWPGKKPFDVAAAPYGKQVLWPVHCVAGHAGAELHFDTSRVDAIFDKGREPARENYSVFTTEDRQKTPFYAMVENLRPEEIHICGLALDFCVQATALDALAIAPKVTVFGNAVQAVSPEGHEETLEIFKRKGIHVETA
ncbi:MAG: isochorismatase family protein [Spirochaetales bacterium]|jgi:nicotinamidase/pyrazinamidase|nr:isochorismatase family protein [Spirochaetales bacterium]